MQQLGCDIWTFPCCAAARAAGVYPVEVVKSLKSSRDVSFGPPGWMGNAINVPLLYGFGFFFLSVSFAKASLNSYVEPGLSSQHDPDTFWLRIKMRFGGSKPATDRV